MRLKTDISNISDGTAPDFIIFVKAATYTVGFTLHYYYAK